MNKGPTDKQLIAWAIENKRVDILVEYKWGYILCPGQIELVRKIAFLEHRKMSVSAMTRWGKSFCVTIGLALLIDFGVPAKIAFLGPKQEQAGILRQYLAELILADKSLLSKAQIYVTGEERIVKEASRKRMTFKTGAEYRVFSGEGDADRLMGFGCVPPGAKIITNQGIMTAEQIWKTGEKLFIYSYNHKSKRCEFQRIKRKIMNPGRNLIKINYTKGDFIVTDNHPVYIKGKGYIEAKHVRNKDTLLKCNCYSNYYGNNSMLSMRKHNREKTESYSESKETLLQSQVQSRMAKGEEQSIVGRWEKENYLQRMWKRILHKQKSNKGKDLLQLRMQRQCSKETTKKKIDFNMQILWKRIPSYTRKKGLSVLFKSVCKQRSCGKNDDGKESSMERRNQKHAMGSRFQQETKKPNKGKGWSHVLFMWKDWILTNTSYRLQQAKQQERESCYFMPQLPLQDQLQKRDVEEVIVTRIEKIPAEEKTYNFEVENNNNYFVDGILTHNCDILVRDEACLINREAYTKSSRMLGDHPESAVEIELFNPWKRDNKAFEHTLDPAWHQIHIGWQQALKEGRTTQRFIDQQRKDLLPMEFTVLYDSNFPEQGEDSLFSLAWINAAEKINFNFHNMQINLRNQIEELRNQRHKMGESQFKSQMDQLQKELAKFINIIACDLAEGGKDETVIIWGIEYDNKFQVVGTYSEPKSEPMRVVGRIVNRAMSFIPGDVKGRVNIDRIGIGSGPLSRLKEVLHTERNLNNIKVTGCHFGEKAIKKDIFHNKKAENYFRLADLMRDQMIDIPVNHKIRAQLVAEGKDRTSSNRRIIVDPEDNSPDWADALVYLVWKDKSGMQFAFS